MVDEFAEEISSSFDALSGAKQALLPTLLIGLGSFGRDCLDRFAAEHDQETTPFLPVYIRTAGPGPRQSGRRDDGQNVIEIVLPAGEKTRAAAFQALRLGEEEIVGQLKEGLTGMLLNGHARGQEFGRINVFIFAEARELDGSALAIGIPRILRSSLADFGANWAVPLTAFVLLPKGGGSEGANVYAMLEDLRRDDHGYERVFLLTGANLAGLIDRAGGIDMINEFCGSLLEPDFAGAVDEVLEIAQAKFASFGATALVHPVGKIVNGESARFTLELINSGLLLSEDEPFYRWADEYLKAEKIDLDNLRRLLLADHADPWDNLNIESLSMGDVPMVLWPDRIASYNDFLAHNRVPLLISRIDRNLADISGRTAAHLRGRVDELITEPAALDKAGQFLARLRERAQELGAQSETRGREASLSRPDMVELHESLVDKVRHLPGPGAIASRALVMTVLVYYFVSRLTAVLIGLPDRYIEPAYLPPPSWAAAASAAATLIVASLIYRRAQNSLFRAKDAYLRAITGSHRAFLESYVYKILGRWFKDEDGASGSDNRQLGFQAAVASEQASLNKLNRHYLKISEKLSALDVRQAETPARRSVYAAFGFPANLRYKKGRYHLPEEVQRFTASGHTDWREIEQDQLDARLRAYCRRGLTYIDNRAVDMLFLEVGQDRDKMRAVIEQLRRLSQPYITVVAHLPHVTELVGVVGGSESALASQFGLFGRAAVIPVQNRYRLTFVQLVCLRDVENLAAFSSWRQAYGLHPDKRGLACIDLGEEEAA